SMGVGSIVSLHGNVTLTTIDDASGNIFDADGDAATDISGNTITINARGNVGSFGNDIDIDSGYSGTGLIKPTSLFGSIDLDGTLGSMPVAYASARGHVNRTAAGSILDAGDGFNVSGSSSILIAGAAIGTAKDALDTRVNRLEGRAGDGGAWIENGADPDA